MPTKEQQRSELHKTIWSIADDLRGSVDGWDFKHYILGTLSKLVSNDEVLANDVNLSASSYVEKPDDREEVDIAALSAEIARIVAREQELRAAIDEIVADLEGEERGGLSS